jgi:tellurite resistance protein TehA-like permease
MESTMAEHQQEDDRIDLRGKFRRVFNHRSIVGALAVDNISPLETILQRDVSLNSQQAARINLCERLKHFTWAWFSMTMATGSLSVVLFMTPNQFKGLFTIGKIIFLFDLVLFCTFLTLITARFIMVPSSLYQSLHKNPTESLFFGAFWVSIALLLQNIEVYGHQYCGLWLTKALEICFWSYAGTVFCVGLFQYYTLFVEERLQVNGMMPAWIIPIYPLLTAGPLAGILLGSQPQGPGLKILLGGIMFQGLGWMVSIFMYTIYMLRLMSAELPEPPLRAGMFLSVGPVCTSAFTVFYQRRLTLADARSSVHRSCLCVSRSPRQRNPSNRFPRK